MSINTQNQDSDQIVRIPIVWVFIGVLAMILLGAVGGMLSSQLWPTQRTPLTNDQEQIVTMVQEVTISPNQAAADVVAKADRSIVGIITTSSSDKTLIAAGIVVTNDGLVMTSATLPKSELVAIDWQGAEVPLRLIGRDELFGLTYLRIEEGLLSPLDIRANNVPIGNELLVVSRAQTTRSVRADNYLVKEWVLPPEIGPSGIQQLLKGTPIDTAVLAGSALIDDETRLAGIVLNKQAGLIIGGDHLLMSMQRIATNKREVDPLGELGIKVHYALEVDEDGKRIFVAEIVSVDKKSWAAENDLRVRDKVRALDNEKLDWQKSFVNQITNDSLQQITVRRENNDVTLNIK